MTTASSKSIKMTIILMVSVLMGCVKDRNFGAPKESCSSDVTANATYAEIKDLFVDETVQIQDELIIEGYVISSDKAGNFFSVLHFQDNPTNPTEGFQIEIDVRDSHLFYPVGSKIFIKLKGLYLGKSKGVFKIGGVFISFGNTSVGRLPANVVSKHVISSCDDFVPIVPAPIGLESLKDSKVNTLVELDAVEIAEDELGLPFAVFQEETERMLMDCDDHAIVLLNSGYADFQTELLPDGNGSIVGVLLKENDDYRIAIRDLDDIDFLNERCEDVVDEYTSDTILISELADPDNNSGARFVELFNSGSESLSLKGWKLNRFTNDNTEVSSTIDLSGLLIEAESTLVISPNATEFEAIYGFAPDLGVGTNSPADSNGDDNLQLVDPFGTVIDSFGVIGEDGSGTDHEFEDGRAVRKPEILQANPTYTFGEWEIFNDTGASGTTNQPQNAPEDFTPGIGN